MKTVLVIKLIKHYERVIEIISKETDIVKIQYIISNNNVEFGICSCVQYEFGDDIYRDDWVNSFKCKQDSVNYWFEVPYGKNDKDQIIDLLQKRVDRLKTFK